VKIQKQVLHLTVKRERRRISAGADPDWKKRIEVRQVGANSLWCHKFIQKIWRAGKWEQDAWGTLAFEGGRKTQGRRGSLVNYHGKSKKRANKWRNKETHVKESNEEGTKKKRRRKGGKNERIEGKDSHRSK